MSRISLRLQIALAFLAIYTIWGSTYLAIRIAIETIPPFLMAGVRFLIAGAALYLWTRLRGAPSPTRPNWKAATVVGGLLLLGGNGGVVWAEQTVPSGLTAVLITTVPLWMALLEWKRYDRTRPALPIVFGLILGFTGVVLLVGPQELAGSSAINRVGATVLILASLSWAIGSLYSRKAPLPSSPLQSTAMEMLAGGLLLSAAGLVSQEWVGFQPSEASLRSIVAFAYLIVFGSLIGFTSYIFLLKATTAAKVSTYAYVNPIIAIILGWAIAQEELTLRTMVAAAIIVAAVVVITTYRATVNHATKTANMVKVVQAQPAKK
ncbi:MAG TPA: drug/metabolite exporter YedA [Candidatus Bathyarchaeia archaeon]